MLCGSCEEKGYERNERPHPGTGGRRSILYYKKALRFFAQKSTGSRACNKAIHMRTFLAYTMTMSACLKALFLEGL